MNLQILEFGTIKVQAGQTQGVGLHSSYFNALNLFTVSIFCTDSSFDVSLLLQGRKLENGSYFGTATVKNNGANDADIGFKVLIDIGGTPLDKDDKMRLEIL